MFNFVLVGPVAVPRVCDQSSFVQQSEATGIFWIFNFFLGSEFVDDVELGCNGHSFAFKCEKCFVNKYWID